MQTKGLGPRALSRLLDALSSDDRSVGDLVNLAPEDMMSRYGLNAEQARAIHDNEHVARQLIERLEQHHIRLAVRGGADYPERLQVALKEKAPPVLFLVGSAELLRRRGVGFCGARDASSEALRSADQVARA